MIIAGAFKGTNNDVRYKPELLDRDSKHAVKYAVNWLKGHVALNWYEQSRERPLLIPNFHGCLEGRL